MQNLSIKVILQRIVSSLADWINLQIKGSLKVKCFPTLPFDYHVGFFDGATSKGLCAAGLFIKLGRDTTLKGWFKTGVGSNIRVEFVALWGLLYLARSWGLSALQVLGDSHVVVNWASGNAQLRSLMLLH